ncbi:MAG: translation initiation factor IF-2 [Clostridiales bacterium]|nr:translation initiation factor IF-2 [Clostridiales bacterium]
MSKKVNEIIIELGITLKELKEYADKMGIKVTDKECVVEDSDASRIISTINLLKGTSSEGKAEGGKAEGGRPKIKAIPVVNMDNVKSKPPAGIPAKAVPPKKEIIDSKDLPEDKDVNQVLDVQAIEDQSVTEINNIKTPEKPLDKVNISKEKEDNKADKDEVIELKSSNKEDDFKGIKSQEEKERKDEKKRKESKEENIHKKNKDSDDKTNSTPVKKEKTYTENIPAVEAKKEIDKIQDNKKEEGYINAPNKPMRFKKISDAATEKKKAEEIRKKQQERKAQLRSKDGEKTFSKDKKKDSSKPSANADNKERRASRDKTGNDNKSFQKKTRETSAPFSSAPVAQKPTKGKKKFFDNKDRQSKFDKHEESPKSRRNLTNNIYEDRALEKKERNKKKYKTKVVEEPTVEELLPEGTIAITVPITVAGLSEQAEISVSKIIMAMMQVGVMVTINQTLDRDTVEMLAEDLGLQIQVTEEEPEIKEIGIETREDTESELMSRPPIITVMGHVDHGKTSLLDAIRNTEVTAGESGGITQHIGASEIEINDKKIVFLDTPGHEAFTTMRARGAQVTDIAVLVVAADDGVMPQTIESISHAKAAGVPIIVAINKMDKPTANPDRIKQELSERGVLVEDWGGDVISVPVSAKKGEGIKDLLEMILLQAEVLELKANPDRLALGTVVEARLDKSKGPVATLLVSNGTLKTGQSVVAGTTSGKIRVMTDFKGKPIRKAGPSTPVEILGLSDVPAAGDEFNAVKDDKTAREIAANRQEKMREDIMAKNASMTLDKLFSQIQEGEAKELNLIIKGDVQGSVGAIISSLEKLDTDEVKIRVIHSGVGTINESDIMLAETSNAIIIGFNVRPTTAVANQAADSDVEIRLYRVIYDIIDDIQGAMKGMLDPEYKEEVLGKATVRETFKVPNLGVIAGCYVTEGIMKRNAQIRLVRDGIIIHEGVISSLKRFKDDAKEVAQGYECGLGIEKYNDLKLDDVIECFNMVEIER